MSWDCRRTQILYPELSCVDSAGKVAASAFTNCLRARESSPIEGGSEDKWYAPGVGLIKDADFELARIEKVK